MTASLTIDASKAENVVGPSLNSDSLTSFNDFSGPDCVCVSIRQIKAGRTFTVTLPGHSVSVFALEVER